MCLVQRNLMLLEEHNTPSVEHFISSGTIWSWIANLVSCLKTSDKSACLDGLTNSLTHKEWLEPIDSADLQALLVSINNIEKETVDKIEDQDVSNSELITNTVLIDEATDVPLPELISAPSNIIDSNTNIDNASEELLEVNIDEMKEDSSEHQIIDSKSYDYLETSGLEMAWDDTTHPELLSVFMDETPDQLKELMPILHKISKQQANENEKAEATLLSQSIKAGSSVVGITAISEIAKHLEEILDYSAVGKLREDMLNKLPEIGDCLMSTYKAVEIQAEEPKELLPLYTFLQEYDFDDALGNSNAVEEIAEGTLDLKSDFETDIVEHSSDENSKENNETKKEVSDLIDPDNEISDASDLIVENNETNSSVLSESEDETNTELDEAIDKALESESAVLTNKDDNDIDEHSSELNQSIDESFDEDSKQQLALNEEVEAKETAELNNAIDEALNSDGEVQTDTAESTETSTEEEIIKSVVDENADQDLKESNQQVEDSVSVEDSLSVEDSVKESIDEDMLVKHLIKIQMIMRKLVLKTLQKILKIKILPK